LACRASAWKTSGGNRSWESASYTLGWYTDPVSTAAWFPLTMARLLVCPHCLRTLSAHPDGVAIEQVRRNHRGCPFTAGHSCPDCATVQRSGGPAPCAEHATDGFRKPHRGSCCFPRTACTQSRQPSLQQSGSSRGVSFKQRLQGPLSTCGGRHSIGSVQHWIAVAMDSQAPRQSATHRP
jgi:hypothetical protein